MSSLLLRSHSFSTILRYLIFFFFNDTATTEIYTLSLHDALPIFAAGAVADDSEAPTVDPDLLAVLGDQVGRRSEEHTSELQSLAYLVCRLLLEKKKKTICTLPIRE